jgi:hypothetical protein
VSQAINASLNLVAIGLLIKKHRGSLFSILLTFTSFPFLTLVSSGSIEWIPALGYLIPSGLGFFVLLAKPQSGSLMAIDWFMKSERKLPFCIFPVVGVFFFVCYLGELDA